MNLFLELIILSVTLFSLYLILIKHNLNGIIPFYFSFSIFLIELFKGGNKW